MKKKILFTFAFTVIMTVLFAIPAMASAVLELPSQTVGYTSQSTEVSFEMNSYAYGFPLPFTIPQDYANYRLELAGENPDANCRGLRGHVFRLRFT